jgi:hypothetical protein
MFNGKEENMPSAAFEKEPFYSFAAGFERFPARQMQTIALVASKVSWSPIEFRDDYRAKANFLRAGHIGLDFDGTMALADALNIFCDSAHVIGTTRNHQIAKDGVTADRFRVVLRLEREIKTVAEYEATARFLVDKHDADPACVDGARLFYPCLKIVSVCEDGESEQVRKAKLYQSVHTQIRRLQAGIMTDDVRALAFEVIPEGGRNVTFYRALKDMVKAGLTRERIYAFLAEQCPTQKSKDALSLVEIERLVNNAFASVEKELAPHGLRVKPQYD